MTGSPLTVEEPKEDAHSTHAMLIPATTVHCYSHPDSLCRLLYPSRPVLPLLAPILMLPCNLDPPRVFQSPALPLQVDLLDFTLARRPFGSTLASRPLCSTWNRCPYRSNELPRSSGSDWSVVALPPPRISTALRLSTPLAPSQSSKTKAPPRPLIAAVPAWPPVSSRVVISSATPGSPDLLAPSLVVVPRTPP